MWSRIPTVIAGVSDEGDLTVLRSGERVGRVYPTHISERAHSWLWVVWGSKPEQGYARSMDEALEMVRSRYQA